jgi:hypothetical protein
MKTAWMKFQDEAAQHITLQNALLWDTSDEKFLWVNDNILDQIEWDVSRSSPMRDMFMDAAVNWIELSFNELIEANIEIWADHHLAEAHAAGFNY